MRFIKYIVIILLCLFLGNCDLWKGELDIDIGDYEAQLAVWNSQNMLDYQIAIEFRGYAHGFTVSTINVKNGKPESSDPPSWLEEGKLSTIPEFYSYIKSEEQRIIDIHKKTTANHTLKVRYNTEYHYPENIHIEVSHQSSYPGNWSVITWHITLTPLEEQETGSEE